MILLCWCILISSGAILRRAGGFVSALVRLRIKIAKASQRGGEMVEGKTYCDIKDRKDRNGNDYDKHFYTAG